MLTADLGGLALAGDEDTELQPGWRAGLSRSAHGGAPLKHTVRLSGLGGPGGTATAVLAEVGQRMGPMDLSVLGEQALFRFSDREWRTMTNLGVRAATEPRQALRLSVLARLSMGQGPTPEGQLLLVATQRITRGRAHRPAPERDRFLAPSSPWRWVEEDMPRSPGTVPGAEPYPSVPLPPEPPDAS